MLTHIRLPADSSERAHIKPWKLELIQHPQPVVPVMDTPG